MSVPWQSNPPTACEGAFISLMKGICGCFLSAPWPSNPPTAHEGAFNSNFRLFFSFLFSADIVITFGHEKREHEEPYAHVLQV